MTKLYQCSKCKKMKWEDEMNLTSTYTRKKDGVATLNSSLCKECRLEIQQKYRDSHKQQLQEYRRRRGREIKLEVLGHYSKNGDEPVCTRCGFSDIRALSIDHVLGGGSAHRQDYKATGNHFYNWLKKENYPSGYQVLCMNCQFIKRHEKSEWRTE